MVCPLHRPVLQETIPEVIGLYDLWSRYEPESEGVLIAYASLHGNTAQAAKTLAGMLEQSGHARAKLLDLARCDIFPGALRGFPLWQGGLGRVLVQWGRSPPGWMISSIICWQRTIRSVPWG